ncbi:hypothetical protein L6164_003272 [Bauhinia variegata]|uniref:Uncharacterized protein n=1 Tax=Bauhinia variegata TaxID=167791 RepID=A0ACB9Q6B0_BAUVA|nr:hypothetical protein L6164_003272 [Bauhinia variegata]
MAAKAENVSREFIKPSSPTPDHLKELKLSLLDGVSPLCYVPIVLFYSASDITSFGTDFALISDKLKKSLSDILTLYYPFCGRMKGNSLVECNDKGVFYSEAKVPLKLSDFLQNPQISQIKEFLPYDPYCFEEDHIEDIGNMGIQLTEFSCGGIAIGLCIMHKIADAATSFSFLNAWGEKARGFGNIVAPQMEAASLFPPRDLGFDLTGCFFVGTNIVTKRFIFDPTSLSNLKAKIVELNLDSNFLQSKNYTFTAAANMVQHESLDVSINAPPFDFSKSYGTMSATTTGNPSPLNPTRVEAVIALTWKAAVEAARATSRGDQASKTWMGLTVNLRKPMVPPLSDNSLGNLWLPSLTPLIEVDKIVELNDHVKLVRETIKKVYGDFLSKVQGDDATRISQALMEIFDEEKSMIEDCPSYMYTSWIGFPLYETDLGWGKPTWVSALGVP